MSELFKNMKVQARVRHLLEKLDEWQTLAKEFDNLKQFISEEQLASQKIYDLV
jgi:hypothetical protein